MIRSSPFILAVSTKLIVALFVAVSSAKVVHAVRDTSTRRMDGNGDGDKDAIFNGAGKPNDYATTAGGGGDD